MEKLEFLPTNFRKIKNFILSNRKELVFSFLNSNEVYQFVRNKNYKESILKNEKHRINFIDGFVLSFLFSILNLKHVERLQGPKFTDSLLRDKELLKNKKSFFVGFEDKDFDLLIKRYPLLERKNLFCYNPPYVKQERFSKDEVRKISKKVNVHKIDYLWIGMSSPKQEFLSADIYPLVKANYIFNVGAAFDFSSGKKKRAPKIFQSFGIEWLYRLITDFKHSKIKVWRSFVGSFYALFYTKMKK